MSGNNPSGFLSPLWCPDAIMILFATGFLQPGVYSPCPSHSIAMRGYRVRHGPQLLLSNYHPTRKTCVLFGPAGHKRRTQSRVDLDRHHKRAAPPLLLPPRPSLDPANCDPAYRRPPQVLSNGAPTHRPSPLRPPRPHRRASGAPRSLPGRRASTAIRPALHSAAP